MEEYKLCPCTVRFPRAPWISTYLLNSSILFLNQHHLNLFSVKRQTNNTRTLAPSGGPTEKLLTFFKVISLPLWAVISTLRSGSTRIFQSFPKIISFELESFLFKVQIFYVSLCCLLFCQKLGLLMSDVETSKVWMFLSDRYMVSQSVNASSVLGSARFFPESESDMSGSSPSRVTITGR